MLHVELLSWVGGLNSVLSFAIGVLAYKCYRLKKKVKNGRI